MKNLMIEMKNLLIPLCALVALGACEANPPGSNAAMESAFEAAQTADSLGIQVGTKPVSTQLAMEIFSKGCVSEVNPATFGLVQNPASKTWYNQEYNLSLNNSHGDRCTMFFGSNEDPVEVSTAVALAATGAIPSNDVDVIVDPNGRGAVISQDGVYFEIQATGDRIEGQPMYLAALVR